MAEKIKFDQKLPKEIQYALALRQSAIRDFETALETGRHPVSLGLALADVGMDTTPVLQTLQLPIHTVSAEFSPDELVNIRLQQRAQIIARAGNVGEARRMVESIPPEQLTLINPYLEIAQAQQRLDQDSSEMFQKAEKIARTPGRTDWLNDYDQIFRLSKVAEAKGAVGMDFKELGDELISRASELTHWKTASIETVVGVLILAKRFQEAVLLTDQVPNDRVLKKHILFSLARAQALEGDSQVTEVVERFKGVENVSGAEIQAEIYATLAYGQAKKGIPPFKAVDQALQGHKPTDDPYWQVGMYGFIGATYKIVGENRSVPFKIALANAQRIPKSEDRADALLKLAEMVDSIGFDAKPLYQAAITAADSISPHPLYHQDQSVNEMLSKLATFESIIESLIDKKYFDQAREILSYFRDDEVKTAELLIQLAHAQALESKRLLEAA
ncbi:MAG: hypothetical protein Q7S61_03590 [bacterium]|nr:hypothetical protein [bacterium]